MNCVNLRLVGVKLGCAFYLWTRCYGNVLVRKKPSFRVGYQRLVNSLTYIRLCRLYGHLARLLCALYQQPRHSKKPEGFLNAVNKIILNFVFSLDSPSPPPLVLAGGCQIWSFAWAVVNLSTYFSVPVSSAVPRRWCDFCYESWITVLSCPLPQLRGGQLLSQVIVVCSVRLMSKWLCCVLSQ